MILTRRTLIKLAALTGLPVSSIVAASVVRAEDKVFKHGSALLGDLKYPPDFRHYDYVNPNAPKGGRLRLAATGSFDSFNPFIIKGEVEGSIGLIVEALTDSSDDEAGAGYGLIAEGVAQPDDQSWVSFRLRKNARWHDGQPITPPDVIFTFDFLKSTNPQYQFYYKNVIKAEQTGADEVAFQFDVKNNRELPGICGQMQVAPKHYWEGTDEKGAKHDISQTTLVPPLGSGPYRLKSFSAGQSALYERVKDYWGAELPVRVGQNNFDEIEILYFRDRTVIFEAFKADQVDVRIGVGSVEWETQYDIPQVKKGLIVKKTFFTKDVQRMQCFIFNLRRAKFADARVRQAFNLAYDFEGQQKVLSSGNYNKRLQSFFQNSDLAATGLPTGAELAILEPYRGRVPEEVFTKEYVNPVNGTPQNLRKNLRQALDLFNQAGWVLKDSKLVNEKTGEKMMVEFLLNDPSFEDIILFYKPNLEKLGIDVTLRTVDSSQYENRVIGRDFDMITDVFPESLLPGNEQREFWGSNSADRVGSRNTIGIKNPVIDELCEAIVFAKTRDELIAATQALDRVLLWNFYVVSQFYRAELWMPHWDRFGYPEKNPDFSIGFPPLWWWDEEKAKRVAASK
jgi:microcin C transport system substrate-binding protein